MCCAKKGDLLTCIVLPPADSLLLCMHRVSVMYMNHDSDLCSGSGNEIEGLTCPLTQLTITFKQSL